MAANALQVAVESLEEAITSKNYIKLPLRPEETSLGLLFFTALSILWVVVFGGWGKGKIFNCLN